MECKNTARVHQLLQEIEKYIPMMDKQDASVSQASVGWQLDHTLKVINGVSGILTKTNAKTEEYKSNFNFARLVLFSLNYFPRGRAKSPKTVLPPEIITEKDLYAQLKKAKIQLENTKPLHKHAHFRHQIFGMLSKKQTMYFLVMHTNHHLKIVRDILKK